MTGNIAMTSTETVDGRDLSVDGSKLDGIEAGATADQTAAEVTSSATGNISATDVDSAIAELESEKLALAGGIMSGALNMGANDITNTGTVTATTFSGALSGTIASATTATTQVAGDDSQKVATTAYADAIVPVGSILMWYGTLGSIPSNWKLCDGSTDVSTGISTPDLRDRFIVGAGNNYAVDASGGSNSNNVTTISVDNDAFNSTTNVVNGVNTDNRPPYYALAFIMRID